MTPAEKEPDPAPAVKPHRRRILPRWLWAGLAWLFVVIGMYALLLKWYTSQTPRLSRNFAAELNARAFAIPRAQRAWPKLQAITNDLRAIPDEFYSSEEYLGPPTDDDDGPKHEWSGTRHPEREEIEDRKWYEVNRPLLPRLRAAANMPSLGFVLRDGDDAVEARRKKKAGRLPYPCSKNPQMLALQIDCVSDFKIFTAMLERDARFAAKAGNGGQAIDNLIAIVGLADQIRELPLLPAEVASWSYLRTALRTSRELASANPSLFQPQQLDRFSKRLRQYAKGGSIRVQFEGERMLFHDVIQRVYSDDGRGNGVFLLQFMGQAMPGGSSGWSTRLIAPFAALTNARRREVLQRYDSLMDEAEAACAKPLWKFPMTHVQRKLDQVPNRDAGDKLIRLFAPAVANLHGMAELTTQERDATGAAMALVRFRMEHDAWPKSLEQFQPASGGLPLDRFTGAPLRYRLTADGPRLYSLGPDRDDDGGKLPAIEPESWFPPDGGWGPDSPPPDGDMVFWPCSP